MFEHVPEDNEGFEEESRAYAKNVGSLLLFLFALAVLVGLAAGTNGCAFLRSTGPKVLDDAAKLCIVANATLPNETIRNVCRIEGDAADVIAVIESITAQPRAQLAAARAVGLEEGRRSVAAASVCR